MNGSTIKIKRFTKPGEIMKDIEFFNLVSNSYTTISRTFSVVYRLDRKAFLDILQQNREDFEKFCMI
jgi:hypothetical protein